MIFLRCERLSVSCTEFQFPCIFPPTVHTSLTIVHHFHTTLRYTTTGREQDRYWLRRGYGGAEARQREACGLPRHQLRYVFVLYRIVLCCVVLCCGVFLLVLFALRVFVRSWESRCCPQHCNCAHNVAVSMLAVPLPNFNTVCLFATIAYPYSAYFISPSPFFP